jgi:uncharacterized protein YegP (UPF0339 family)
MMGLALGAFAGGMVLPSTSDARAAEMTFEMYKDRGGEFRWRLKATNGQVIATGGQGYTAKADCRHAIELIQKGAATATIVDDTAKS